MTPAEHYAEAERLLKMAVGDFPAEPIHRPVVALAQVHATLATASPAIEHVRCGCGHILTQHGIDRGRCIQPTCTCPAYEEAGEW